MTKISKSTRIVGIGLCEAFSIATLIRVLLFKRYNHLLLSLITPIMILIPSAVEHLFSCHLSLSFFLYSLFYAIGPLLGECYSLYYSTSWWDKLLHISGGVMFAILGLYLFGRYFSGDSQPVVVCALCALCFSVSISAIWEMFEFGMDVFFGLDMQNDTYVSSITSTFFGKELGDTGTVDNIKEVIADGKAISEIGYIDIGLIDTMLDMLLESLGALAVACNYIFKNGRFVTITPRENFSHTLT